MLAASDLPFPGNTWHRPHPTTCQPDRGLCSRLPVGLFNSPHPRPSRSAQSQLPGKPLSTSPPLSCADVLGHLPQHPSHRIVTLGHASACLPHAGGRRECCSVHLSYGTWMFSPDADNSPAFLLSYPQYFPSLTTSPDTTAKAVQV